MRRLAKGIEPIIAVIVLVAVTLVIAVGVIGWIMGWWGTFGATESLKVFPDSYINATNKQLVLHIKNEGSAPAVIYKVEIVGLKVESKEATISPGEDTTITLSITQGTPVSGTAYTVKVYTRAGNVVTATVQAK